jgi:hypothetical protein
MGFVSDILGGKLGVELYYIIGLLIFISLFVVIVNRTIRMTKKELKGYKESILDGDDLS